MLIYSSQLCSILLCNYATIYPFSCQDFLKLFELFPGFKNYNMYLYVSSGEHVLIFLYSICQLPDNAICVLKCFYQKRLVKKGNTESLSPPAPTYTLNLPYLHTEHFILRMNWSLSEHLLHKKGWKDHIKKWQERQRHDNRENPTPKVAPL